MVFPGKWQGAVMAWKVSKIEGEVIRGKGGVEVSGGGYYNAPIRGSSYVDLVVRAKDGRSHMASYNSAGVSPVEIGDQVTLAIFEDEGKMLLHQGLIATYWGKPFSEEYPNGQLIGLKNHTLDRVVRWEPDKKMPGAPLAFLAGLGLMIWGGLGVLSVLGAIIQNPEAIIPSIVGTAMFLVPGFLLFSFAKKKKRNAAETLRAIEAQREAIIQARA